MGKLKQGVSFGVWLLSYVKTDKEQGLLDMLLGTSLDPHSLIRIFSICFWLIPRGLTEDLLFFPLVFGICHCLDCYTPSYCHFFIEVPGGFEPL